MDRNRGQYMNIGRKWRLLLVFILCNVLIFSFKYPLPHVTSPEGKEIWVGGTIPDEHAYFGWAQIYAETGNTYLPLEDIGPPKLQHVDFYLGDTGSSSIFASVKVSDPGSEKELRSKERNVTIFVYDGNDNGISSMLVSIMNEHQTVIMNGQTSLNGTYTFVNVPPGKYQVTVPLMTRSLKLLFATDYPQLNYPIEISAHLDQFTSNGADISIHVDHYINKDLEGVDIYKGFNIENKEPEGATNSNGDFLLHVDDTDSMYHVTAYKENEGYKPPPGSGIIEMDGDLVLVNHWPPGYCYLLIPFWLMNSIILISFYLLGLASLAIYILAMRLYNKDVAYYSTLLFMSTSLGLVILFNRGLADYASMTFALLGIMLFIESYEVDNPLFQRWAIGIAGGLSLGFAVTMRYSTLVVVLGPMAFVLLTMLHRSGYFGGEGGMDIKSFISKLRSSFMRSLPFIIALVLIGVMLAQYNSEHYGGALNSGYQTDRHVDDSGGNITVDEPDDSMFGSYFNPSAKGLSNFFTRVMPQLLFVLPTLFLAPLALLTDLKRRRTGLMLFWTLPVVIIYMQLRWVGRVPIEDMRYYLPLLPPTAILAGYAFSRGMRSGQQTNGNGLKDRTHDENEPDDGHLPTGLDKKLMTISLLLILLLGFTMAQYGMHWQLNRRELGMMFRPPPHTILFAAGGYILYYFTLGRNRLDKWRNKKPEEVPAK